MNSRETGPDPDTRLKHFVALMLDFRVTAYGLAAMVFGLHAVRWLVGRKIVPSESGSSHCGSVGPSSPYASSAKSDNKEVHPHSPLESPASPSRSLADHPLLGPALFASDTKPSRGESSNDNENDLQCPETPRMRRRVKMLRFEDMNGSSSSHHTAHDSTSPASLGEGTPFSQEHASRSPRSFQSAQDSPYANAPIWSQPAMEADGQLATIPEGKEHETQNGHSRGHRRGLSTATDNGDSTPFTSSAIDLASAPTRAGEAVNDEQVSSALAVVEQLQPKRHSRSFSESNLAAMSQNADTELQSALRAPMGDEGTESSDASPDYHAERAANMGDAQDYSQERSSSGNGGLTDPPYGRSDVFNPFYENINQNQNKRKSGEHRGTPPLLRLEVITGPSRGQDYTMEHDLSIVPIGRHPGNLVVIEDSEVSNHHVQLQWSAKTQCWVVQDLGSTNGTRLNGNFISLALPKPGKSWKLSSDDILLLGHQTSIKVCYLASADVPTAYRKLKLYAPPSGLQPCLTMKSEAMSSLRAELGIEKAVQEKSLRLDVAMVCHTGSEHKRMDKPCEDVPFLGEAGSRGAALYCVFDGHCGKNSSQQCASLLPESLRKRMASAKPLLNSGEGLGGIWEDVFLEVDGKLETEDGTTATAVLVWKAADNSVCLQAANVGDSAAVLWRSSHGSAEECEQLTVDHRVCAPLERQRLADLGIVLKEGANRLYGLNVSRCLGDRFVKEAELGFSAVPSVSAVVRLPAHESGLLVLASDGLWDVANPSQVMQVACKALKESPKDTESIAQAVYQLAMDKRTRDDITVTVLSFYPEKN